MGLNQQYQERIAGWEIMGMDNSSVKPFNFWENTVEFIVHLKHINYIFPIKHKEENRLRIEGADGNVIFNVIVPTNPPKDEQKEEE